MRGNLQRPRRWSAQGRSIPAGAGEPKTPTSPPSGNGVYPRGCGGTGCPVPTCQPRTGLSPRVRGNHHYLSHRRGRPGSIPAGAGEPPGNGSLGRICRVYPRGCGGTLTPRSSSQGVHGLSPRVRGNHHYLSHRRGRPGSIPAGAGEPPGNGSLGRICRVYPRGCGGTLTPRSSSQGVHGLSPRVRGNHHYLSHRRGRPGSIPAGAGEPCHQAVYPRGCGGTPSDARDQGLSPRVRGNLDPAFLQPGSPRSIPAGAGEPLATPGVAVRPAVYPRGCGGTPSDARCRCETCGLSPRVRGNP